MPCELVDDALSEDVNSVFQLSAFALVKGIIPEIVKESQVCDGLECHIEAVGIFEAQVGIFIVVDTVSYGEIQATTEPG